MKALKNWFPNQFLHLVLTLAATVSLVGCAGTGRPGFPKQSYSEAGQIKQLENLFNNGTMISHFYELAGKDTTPPDQLKQERNKIIDARLALIDLNYNQFVSQFSVNKQTLDTVTEVTELGLNLATTAVGGAGTKTILGAIASGVTGTKLAIDKNFFYEKTVPVLISGMNAQRKTALLPIFQGTKQSIQDYPLAQTLSDLDIYYFAGTFLGALQGFQADAGSKEVVADDKLAKFRSSSYAEDQSSAQIRAFLWPSGLTKADGTPNDPNADNLKALRDWMAKPENGVGDLPIQKFLDSALLASARKKAIQDLHIPAVTANP